MVALILDPMQRDAARLADYEEQLANGSELKALLYFYTWDKPSLTAGRLQNANVSRRESLLKLSQQQDLPLYIRPTGGRTVLHGGDICYTFIATLDDPDFGGNLKESFCKVNRFVFSNLRHITELREFFNKGLITASIDCGVDVDACKTDDLNCFATAVTGEALLIANNQAYKFIGAAQAMGKKAFIQQGSIQLNRVLNAPSELEAELLLADIQGADFDLAKITEDLNQLVININGAVRQ